MRLKVPPIVVFMVSVLLMYLLARFMPFGDFDFFWRSYLMYALLGIALALGVVALVQFFRTKTTIDPTKPSKASKLVSDGIYRFSRNPMYLGLLIMLLVFGLWLGNAFNILVVAGFVAYMNKFQIIPEEDILTEMFGEQYLQFRTRVRRWL